MRIRNLLLGLVLAMMVLFAGSFTTNTVKADACTDWCVNMYNDCAAQCNGNQICLRICRDEYKCCMSQCGVGSGPCL